MFVQSVSENVGLDMTFVKDIAGERVLGALETMGVCLWGSERMRFHLNSA